MHSEQTDQLVLLRSFKERVRLVFLGAALAAFMVFMLSEIFKWRPHGIIEHALHAGAVEIFMAFALFGSLGFIWGLFAPRWLEGFLARDFRRVIRIICLIAVASVCSVIFYLLRQ